MSEIIRSNRPKDIDSAEITIASIWKSVLGVESTAEIGFDDDFFELGGTSLSLIAVIAKMSEQFGVELPTAIAANGATISALARAASEEISTNAF